MRGSFIAVVAWCALSKAQNATAVAYAATPASYSMSTWASDDCTTLPDITLTSTNTMIVTYCSECEMMTHGGSTVHTTVYQTTLVEWCPTGVSISGSLTYMTPHTYTITESCSKSAARWSSSSDWIPAGYTTEVQICTVCGDTGMTATMTFPASYTTRPSGVTVASVTSTPWTSTSWAPVYETPSPATYESTSTSSEWSGITSIPGAITPSTYLISSDAPPTITSGVAHSSSWSTPSTWGNTTGITAYTGSAASLSADWFIALCRIAFVATGAVLL